MVVGLPFIQNIHQLHPGSLDPRWSGPVNIDAQPARVVFKGGDKRHAMLGCHCDGLADRQRGRTPVQHRCAHQYPPSAVPPAAIAQEMSPLNESPVGMGLSNTPDIALFTSHPARIFAALSANGKDVISDRGKMPVGRRLLATLQSGVREAQKLGGHKLPRRGWWPVTARQA